MSSARDSNWRPQPPNLQELEKKEAAAMPVMLPALVHPPGEEAGGKRSVRVNGGGSAAERRAAEQTPGQADSTAADAAGKQAGRWGWGWAPAAWWPPTSRAEYLEAAESPAEILLKLTIKVSKRNSIDIHSRFKLR